MNTSLISLAGTAVASALIFSACSMPPDSQYGPDPAMEGTGASLTGSALGIVSTGATSDTGSKAQGTYVLQTVATGLVVPWDMAFAGSGRILVTERGGRLRQVVDGRLVTEPVYTFSGVSRTGEEGLMGIALDPDYANNNYLYLCLARVSGSGMTVDVVRARDRGDGLDDIRTILPGLAAAQYHAGCTVRFAADGTLYATAGDGLTPDAAQSIGSLAGKILRIRSDGSIPSDNPFPDSPVWSYGHRNIQGIAWQPGTGELYVTEHGPSGFDGARGGDEINRIAKGQNYGWPVVSHAESATGMVSPLRTYTPAVAPASAVFYSGSIFPELRGDLLFGGLVGEGVYRVSFSPDDPSIIQSSEKLALPDIGRVRLVTVAPDGSIYITTSNRDHRGTARE
jgi:aldose sugar dehydrogenase